MSIVGIVLSLVVGAAGTIVVLEVATSVAHSPAADPACISAKHDATQMGSTLNADGAAITRDENNPAAVRTDLQKFQTDMQSLQGQLSSAQGEGQQQSVKTRIAALNSDIGTLNASMQAIESGNTSQASQLNTVVNKLQSDGDALDSTCSTL